MLEIVSDEYTSVRALIADVIDVDEDELQPDSRFVEEIGADSLMALEVLLRLEREYDIRIPESELPRLISLREVLKVLREMGATRGDIDANVRIAG